MCGSEMTHRVYKDAATSKVKAIAPGVFFPRAETTVNEAAVGHPAPSETARLCLREL